MLTTLEILKQIKKKHGNCTDYRVAKLLGIKSQTVYTWEGRGSVMDDEIGLKAAELLDLNPEYVIQCLHAERMKDRPSYALLARIANRLDLRAAAASFALLAVFCANVPSPFFLA